MIADDPPGADVKPGSGLLRFGPFELNLRQRTLAAGGALVRLDGKTFDLLEMLVLRSGETLTKAEIIREVWRGRAVSDKNVDVQMSALRRALAEHSGGAAFIKTLPDQRYRFVAEVESPPPPDQPDHHAVRTPPADPATQDKPARPRRASVPVILAGLLACVAIFWWLQIQRRQAAAPDEPSLSIIVLPFRNLSADPAENYLADAVTDDLNAELQRIPDSVVIARETAEIYQARKVPVDEIGHALKVRYLLEGSVQPEGSTLHIDAKLIDTETQKYLWQGVFDIERSSPGAARDLIVARIAASLDFQLVRAETARSLRERPTNPAARDLFLRARSILDHEDTLPDYAEAERLLDQAIEKQPDYGEALAEMGWMLVCKTADIDDPQEGSDVAKARAAVARALAISSRDAVALSAQGRLRAFSGDYAGAILSANAALAASPNSIDAQLTLASASFYIGDLAEAARALRASLLIDPEGPGARRRIYRLGNILLLQGDYAGAIDLLNRSSIGDVDPPPGAGSWGRMENTRLLLIAAHWLGGDHDGAQSLYQGYKLIWPNRTAWRVGSFAPRTLSRLPGWQAYILALNHAGMPYYADEHVDDHVPPTNTPIEGEYFAPTPLTVPGAKTIDTEAMAKLVNSPAPRLVLDVGQGTAGVAGAKWLESGQGAHAAAEFAKAEAATFRQRFPLAPIIVMSDGVYGASSYNATLGLIQAGYDGVFWYRGGEEAWAKAGKPLSYLRGD
jgi:TolB-like protein/DNA-binding winged helix-turn-helix (wHTH) protein